MRRTVRNIYLNTDNSYNERNLQKMRKCFYGTLNKYKMKIILYGMFQNLN